MEIKKTLLPILAVLLVTNIPSVLAYDDDTTHPALTQEVIEFYNLSFPNQPITDEQREWIIQGSILEDTPPRWINHFYDPINKVGWTGEEAGKISAEAVRKASLFISTEKPLSAVEWVKNDLIQESYRSLGGNRSWQRGLDYYLDGDEKEFYITLGHILHILEDMGVPDHARNDTHAHDLESVTGDPGSPLEKYTTRWNRDSINGLAISQGLVANSVQAPTKGRIEDYLISLAEYSNRYFFSRDTINNPKYQFPKIVREDESFAYGVDENGVEFPLAKIKKKEVSKFTFEKSYILEQIDEKILDAYFIRLSRQIVLNGVGVIALFKKEAEDAVVNEEFYGYDFLRNRRARSIARFPAIPNFSFVGMMAQVGDIGVSVADTIMNTVRNVAGVITSPVRNIASQIGGQADLAPEAPPGAFQDFRVPAAEPVEEVEETEEAEEEIAEDREEEGDKDAEAPVDSPSAEELAQLQAQVAEAARQVEVLRERVQVAAAQTRTQAARRNTAVFEEEKEQEEEEEREAELAAARVYDASYNSGGGGSGGGGGGGSGSAASPAEEDTTAPAAITNLAVASTATSSVSISWTAPGDDGASGTAASYTVRYATTTITGANWPSLVIFSGAPAPLAAGTSQSATLTGFTPGTTYYFAIKSEDEEGNESGLSNIASAKTDLPIPDTSNVNHVLISEAQVAGVDAGDEFIELYNPADSEVDISGWSLQYLSGSASSTAEAIKKNFESESAITARSYFLVARGLNASSTDGYTGERVPNMTHRTFSLSGAVNGATIFLVKNQETVSGADDPDIVDRLAYGSGAGLVAETSPAPVPQAGQSLERKAWISDACASATGNNEFSGNGCDTGNNSSDFGTRSAPNPQNLANLPESRSAPEILNLSASYSSSTMSADFSWTLSQDARGATSTNVYTISQITSTSTVQLFSASSTQSFSTPVSEDTDFEFQVEDWEGMSRNTTTTVSSSFYSYLGVIWEQSQKDISISANEFGFGGSPHSWAQTLTPQRSGPFNTAFIEWAPWTGSQIVDGMASCNFRLYRANSPAAANESNLISNAIFFGSSSSGSGPVCIVGDFLSPSGTYHFATTTITAGETYTFIFNYTEATHAPFLWGSSDIVPGSFWIDGVERPAKDVRLKLSGIVTSPLMFTEPPTQPTNLQMDFDQFNLALNLSWDASSDSDSGFHYQTNYTTSTALSADGWQSVGSSTTASIPLVYPNTYKVGVRARDDFYNISTSTVSDWTFPASFTTGDGLASQLDNNVLVGSTGQATGQTVEWGQTFSVATTSVPYSIRLKTAGVVGGSCWVKIYAADSIQSANSGNLVATSDTLSGNACDASSSKTFQFSSTGTLIPATTYIWIYGVEGGGGGSAHNDIYGGQNGYSENFFYRITVITSPPVQNGGPFQARNAYFELFGDLAE